MDWEDLVEMKILILIFVIFSLIFPIVSADLISINSGGTNSLVMNPNNYLEGFFLWANRFPVAVNLILSSTSGQNSTNDNLTISYSVSDADNDPITNITDWRLNGNSIAVLNMPFNKRVFTTNAGAVRDYSSFASNGTLGAGVLANSPNWTKTCQVGGCFTFDGVDDYINVGNPSNLNLGTNNFTINLWVNPSQFTAGQRIIAKRASSLGNGWEIGEGVKTSTKWGINILNSTSFAGADFPNGGTSGWNMLTMIRIDNTILLYLNGDNPTSTTNSIFGTNLSNANNLFIGSFTTSGSVFFNGSIDEVLIFNRSLSAQEIKEIYNAGVAGRELEKMVSQELNKGDVWQVALTPNDIYDDGITIFSNILTIENVAPFDPTNVKLVSLNGRNESDTDLNCSAYISDADNNNLTVFLRWYKNNNLNLTEQFNSQNNNTLFSTLLSYGNLTLGDVWKCSIRTYDLANYSNWVNSSNLTIIDITNPNVTIISPNSTYNYTSLNVDFNISISENENISWCGYSLNGTANATMNRFNDTYFWFNPANLIPGTHNVTFWCNDTSGNWGTNWTNFTILNEAAISILLSPALSWSVNWSLLALPANNLDANGNNGPNPTDYYINISTSGIGADIYVEADGDLHDAGLDILKLGNETYSVNMTNSSVPNLNKINMTTSYALIGDNVNNGSVIYMKFFLNAPSGQPAGTYTNGLIFKAVMHGQAP